MLAEPVATASQTFTAGEPVAPTLFRFNIDQQFVPEPASALLLLVAGMLTRRTRR